MKTLESFDTPIDCDFLIIGAGLSGLYSALYASEFGKVCILTKSSIDESNSYWAQGGIAAAIDTNDSVDSHFEDTIAVGSGLNKEDSSKIMVREGFDRVNELVKMGMEFDSDSSGFELGIEGGHSKRRILHALGNETGRAVVEFLSKKIEKNKNIKILENTSVIELFSDKRECFGCLVQGDKVKKKIAITAKSTILATGGACGIYYNSTNPSATSGDGIIMGINAGATAIDMEFVQFHPTVFFKDGAKNFLISEALRGEGAKLTNHSGKQFMKNYSAKKELASRDIVSKAIFNEMKTNGEKNVFLNLEHLDPSLIKSRFKNTYELCLREGIDITKEKIPVAPAAHYMIGGIKTDIYARTNIKNLYACGEVACSGAHGANRLASNSLLECLVFSKRAVDSSLEFSRKIKKIPSKIIKRAEQISLISSEKKFEKYLSLRMSISQLINNYVGILRNKKELLLAMDEISSIKKKDLDLNDIIENRILNLKTLSYIMTKSALIREESRGCHMREDFSTKNDKWLKHINWKFSSGSLRFSYTNH